MNFISKNKSIILIIVILLIIYLLSKKKMYDTLKYILKNTLKNIFKNLKSKIEAFNTYGDVINNNSDKLINKHESPKHSSYHSENLKTSEAEQLYDFLQTMVTPINNIFDLTTSSTKKIKSDKESNNILISFLKQKLDKKIKNLKLLDNIYYFKNQVCLEIQPFQIEGDYIVDDEFLGKVKVQIELTFKFDQPNDIFISSFIFNKYSGVFKINRSTLINHKTKKETENKVEKKKNLPVSLEKPVVNSKYDFNYENNLDTVNSLIPEEIEVTEYEEDSSI